MNIIIPEDGVNMFTMPDVPASASPALAAATARYLADFDGDGSKESGDRWTAAADAIANHVPETLTDIAVKLLFVTHYLYPSISDGKAAIDLSEFDVDAGRKLLRCASDVLNFSDRQAASRDVWSNALADYQEKRSASDELPTGDPNEDAAVDAYADAMDHLIINVPAPDLQAVTIKTNLAIERSDGFGLIEDFWQAIRADLDRLSKKGS
jgi:hypothetical protein